MATHIIRNAAKLRKKILEVDRKGVLGLGDAKNRIPDDTRLMVQRWEIRSSKIMEA